MHKGIYIKRDSHGFLHWFSCNIAQNIDIYNKIDSIAIKMPHENHQDIIDVC